MKNQKLSSTEHICKQSFSQCQHFDLVGAVLYGKHWNNFRKSFRPRMCSGFKNKKTVEWFCFEELLLELSSNFHTGFRFRQWNMRFSRGKMVFCAKFFTFNGHFWAFRACRKLFWLFSWCHVAGRAFTRAFFQKNR